MSISFCLPAGLIAAAIYNLLEALKSPEEAVGYWGGCGKKHFFNFVNPGGIVLYSVIGGSFALMICLGCFALCAPHDVDTTHADAHARTSTIRTHAARTWKSQRAHAALTRSLTHRLTGGPAINSASGTLPSQRIRLPPHDSRAGPSPQPPAERVPRTTTPSRAAAGR